MRRRLNFSVERRAAGDACLQIRLLDSRRPRSPFRWADHVMSLREHIEKTPARAAMIALGGCSVFRASGFWGRDSIISDSSCRSPRSTRP